MKKIYFDENHNFKFDFSEAEDVVTIDELAQCIPELQYNVDFIIVKDNIVFLEFKDSKIENPDDENRFRQKLMHGRDMFCKNMAKKFVSSLFWLWACNGNEKERKISYYLLIESDIMDVKIRKMFRNKISRQLPHNYERYGKVQREILSDFEVINLEEWHKIFPQYIITEWTGY